jgi:hypothetical protein
MTYRVITWILFVIGFSALQGCASTVSVSVNAILDHELETEGKRYVLVSGMPDTSTDDLYFREFSRYFEQILKTKGFTRVKDRTEADMEIAFRYAISDGRTAVYSYTSPIYDFVGGETITITERASTSTGQQKTTTITIPARLERIGTSVETRGYTVYTRTAILEARKLNDNGEMGAGEGESPILWNTFMHSVGESNDLRSVMPYMAVAATPYIATNSGQQVTVNVKRDDPAVMQLRQRVLP